VLRVGAGIIAAMPSEITVRWIPAESWLEVADEAWQVLHDAGLGVAHFSFVQHRPKGEAEAVAQTSGGTIVGVVTVEVKPEGYGERYEAFHGLPGPRAFVNHIGVAESARGSGVGRMLMRAAAEEVSRRGGQRLALTVDLSTDEANRVEFFRRCGLRSLRQESDNDLYGAEVAEVLAATAD
jgi:ribosomal protein S18 acetylase RimI-like enzyme